ncbi:MAG: hypothetical protein A2V79_11705 [Betaproteobacteria bacterium RBG_16_56_24]|nr:MAG: hypothetical protein A2V79_11705 [Betaproteobacteria bacterium RBG_16_56_24]
MLHPLSKFPAHRARLAGVRRVNVNHGQPSTLRFVSNKVLELPESPAMQSRSDALSGLDVGPDVRQVFHADFTRAGTDSLCNDGLAGFVVRMFHMPLFTTGDSAELAFSSPATVGLETTTMGKVDVPVMLEFSTAPDLASTGSCEVILTNITPHHATTGNRSDIGKIEGEIEIPDALADDQFGFFGCATSKQVALMLATNKRNLGTPCEGEQRKRVALDRVGALVEVDGRGLEGNRRNRLVFGDAFVGLERLVSIGHTMDSLAHHLATKRRKLFAHRVIGQVVQSYPVPAAMLDSKRNDGVAGLSIGIGKRRQCQRLFGRSNQLERYRSSYHIGENMRYSKESQEQQPSVAHLSLLGLKAGVSRSKI